MTLIDMTKMTEDETKKYLNKIIVPKDKRKHIKPRDKIMDEVQEKWMDRVITEQIEDIHYSQMRNHCQNPEGTRIWSAICYRIYRKFLDVLLKQYPINFEEFGKIPSFISISCSMDKKTIYSSHHIQYENIDTYFILLYIM